MPPSPEDLRAFYQDFKTKRLPDWEAWRKTYVGYASRIANAKREEWSDPSFQKWLWRDDGATTVGSGNAVVLGDQAYGDKTLVDQLWELRNLREDLPRDNRERAKVLQQRYDELIAYVHPKFNDRRPLAKAIRIFAGIFPYDITSIVSGHNTYLLRRLLGLRKDGLEAIGNQVRIRHLVSNALGAPKSLEEAIEQSMFCWYLVEEKSEDDSEVVVDKQADQPQDAPQLKLQPFNLQRKGLPMAGHLDLHLIMLRAVDGGASKDELATAVREEWYESAATSTINVNLGIAKAALGVIQVEDGALRPTKRGQALLEGEDPADVLTPIMIARIFGFAQLLHELEAKGPLPKADLFRALRAWYPRWKNNIQPRSTLRWAKDLRLVESVGDDKLALTETGRYWATGLPRDLEPWRGPAAGDDDSPDADDKEPTKTTEAELDESDDDSEPVAFQRVTYDKLASTLAEQDGHLVLEDGFLATLHTALHGIPHKRFVLLTGLSGTGKSAIATAYARAYCAVLKLNPAQHFKLIPVRPDWTDPSGLLGYPNPLVSPPEFAKTRALELIMRASEDRANPYFLCLDEMNLAKVEHYFAPFLSAMEDPRAELPIHSEREAISGVPGTLLWPANLFVIGTVNMDETTHAFSDKVLDRAFSFELWDVDLERWKEKATQRHSQQLVAEVGSPLQEIHAALHPARRHFGYRTCDEILAFLAETPDGVDRKAALDAAVLAKVLPKVRGDDAGELPAALGKLDEILERLELPRSRAKVKQLRQGLETLGVARYFA